MAIQDKDLFWYGSATMPDDDTVLNIGGAISLTKKITWFDIDSDTLKAVSSSASDTAVVITAYGRNSGGAKISEAKTLTGTSFTAVTTATFERLMKAVASGTAAVGDIAMVMNTAERSNTAVGVGADYIDLDASANATDDYYTGMVIRIDSATAGAYQLRTIVKYVGASKRAYISRDWGTTPTGTITFSVFKGVLFDALATKITEVRRPFYDTATPTSGSRNYYEKFFIKNTHATLDLTNGQLKEVSGGASAKIDFLVAATLDDTGSNGAGNNRQVAPSGTFDSADKNIANSGTLTHATAQGVWLKLTLASTDAAADTTYSMQVAGQSV